MLLPVIGFVLITGRCATENEPGPDSFCDSSDPSIVACLGFDGSLTDGSVNNLVPDSIVNVSFTEGVHGQAARFDSTSFCRFPSSAAWDFERSTVEFRIYPEQMPASGGRSGCIDSDLRFGIFIMDGGFISCGFGGARVTGPAIETMKWTHIACVNDTDSIRIYINGVPSASAASDSVAPAPQSSTITIGSNNPSGDPLIGRIDDLRVFSVARSAAAIAKDATIAAAVPMIRSVPYSSATANNPGLAP